MKCPKCGGTGWDIVHGFDCVSCDGKGEITMTNEEYIRQCSTEELNTLLCALTDCGILNEWRTIYHCGDSDEDAVRIWLKEKHHD